MSRDSAARGYRSQGDRQRRRRSPTIDAAACQRDESFDPSYNDTGRNLIDVAQLPGIDLLCVGRDLERKRIGIGVGVRLEIRDTKRVLRTARHSLRGDDVLVRNRPRADLDPDLPVGVLAAEGEMLAFDTIDHAA